MATSTRSSSSISSQLDNQGSRFGVVYLDTLINRRPLGHNLAWRAVKGLAVQQRVDLAASQRGRQGGVAKLRINADAKVQTNAWFTALGGHKKPVGSLVRCGKTS